MRAPAGEWEGWGYTVLPGKIMVDYSAVGRSHRMGSQEGLLTLDAAYQDYCGAFMQVQEENRRQLALMAPSARFGHWWQRQRYPHLIRPRARLAATLPLLPVCRERTRSQKGWRSVDMPYRFIPIAHDAWKVSVYPGKVPEREYAMFHTLFKGVSFATRRAAAEAFMEWYTNSCTPETCDSAEGSEIMSSQLN